MWYWAGAGKAGTATAAAVLTLVLTEAAHGQARVALGGADPVEARVWLGQGEEPLLQRGDQVRVYYRASQDAYVAIFHIDTDGTTRLAFPHSPDENHYVRGGRDYRLLFPARRIGMSRISRGSVTTSLWRHTSASISRAFASPTTTVVGT